MRGFVSFHVVVWQPIVAIGEDMCARISRIVSRSHPACRLSSAYLIAFAFCDANATLVLLNGGLTGSSFVLRIWELEQDHGFRLRARSRDETGHLHRRATASLDCFMVNYGPRLVCGRRRTDVMQILSSRVELRCFNHFFCFIILSTCRTIVRAHRSPSGNHNISVCRRRNLRRKVMLSTEIHPGAAFLHHIVKTH